MTRTLHLYGRRVLVTNPGFRLLENLHLTRCVVTNCDSLLPVPSYRWHNQLNENIANTTATTTLEVITVQFSEKLDFLMKVTNTSNSALALNIKLDPSHISRLRRGERSALKNEACLDTMAAYFARHCEQDYQKKAIFEALGQSPFLSADGSLPALIASWLSSGGQSEVDTVESFLSGLARVRNEQSEATAVCRPAPERSKREVEMYFGPDGKRRAVLAFLSDVLDQCRPQTLLLFSDESMDWLSDDRDFVLKWESLMTRFLAQGGKIKIIHTVSRDLDEMLSAINQWMPLYLSGSIEPYYYPKKRDGLFKRTLFVAPHVSAVVSSSVGGMYPQAANLLFRDKSAISAFEHEFLAYLSLCKVLMHIFTAKEEAACLDTLRDFENAPCNAVIRTESLSLLTMPELVSAAVATRIRGLKPDFFLAHQKNRLESFRRNLGEYSYTEIIRPPSIGTVLHGGVKVSLSDLPTSSPVFYTADEYITHLENLAALMTAHENFHVRFSGGSAEDGYMIYVKEDFGAVLAKTTAPPAIIVTREDNMRAAFWDYLRSIAGGELSSARSRDESKKKLADYIQRLRNGVTGQTPPSV